MYRVSGVYRVYRASMACAEARTVFISRLARLVAGRSSLAGLDREKPQPLGSTHNININIYIYICISEYIIP